LGKKKREVKQITLKDGTVLDTQELMDISKLDEKDWRGLISLCFVAGLFISIVILGVVGQRELANSIIAMGGPLVIIIIRDYFKSKEKNE